LPFFLILFLIALYLYGIFWFSRKLFRKWHDWHWRQRLGFGAIALAVIASPYLALKTGDYFSALSRVPQPLHASAIEYRVEKAWGFGPGGNETGFVVYRLGDRALRGPQTREKSWSGVRRREPGVA
jgi:hypothetical protein